MALYWPKEKVALDIIDDPHRNPFEGDDDYTVLRVTCADLTNYDSFSKIARHLSHLLGHDLTPSADWYESNKALHDMIFDSLSDNVDDYDYPDDEFSQEVPEDSYAHSNLDNVEILAPDAETADAMRAAAMRDGRHVRKVSIWEGPVPQGSFEQITGGIHMSTPEYFFFRKANQLPFAEAVQLGVELCGRFRTSLTQYDAGEEYDYLTSSRTSTERIRSYLRGATGTKECKRARRVLRFVTDDAGSPMASYLYLHLCLSRSHGGYGLDKAELSRVYDGENGLMPTSSGPYLAYDLVWPLEAVAVQYVGRRRPSEKQVEALEADGMSVICVTDEDVADAKSLDRTAHKVAKLLGIALPEDDEKWHRARTRLRQQIELPTYRSMRLTLHDIEEHQVD